MMVPSERVAEALASATIHCTDYAGGQLHWQQWAATDPRGAVPLVLLHGGFGSWNHWLGVLPALRQHRDVWTVDLPGLGASGEMPKPFTTKHFADILWSGLKGLLGGHQPFALAGFSFGAMIAAQLAILAGGRCTRCTLIGAVGFGELQVQVPLLAPPSADTGSGEADRITRENLRRLMLFKAEAVDELAVYLHRSNLEQHRFRSRKIAVTNELAELLPEIQVPLVGLWGAEDATAGGVDRIEERRQVFLLAQPGAEFQVIPDAGHWVMYEAREAVNRVLLADVG